MLEKSRVVRVRGGELPYHIFTYILYGADSVTKQELQLHANSAAECSYYKNSQVNNHNVYSSTGKIQLSPGPADKVITIKY